jgi:glycogen debranching enzyme
MGKEVVARYGRPDGLLDFGEGSEKMLETRTEGYQHVVAATNGLAAAYFRRVAEWCRARGDGDAGLFESYADRLLESLNRELWDEKSGWFVNLYPDGERHLVWSYHLFDLLGSGTLTGGQTQRLISHLREGEFLAPYGMYSISRQDEVHWDREDVDWGGGGQYTGMPLRIAESLYRLDHPEVAWDILARCTKWTRMYPYISQEIFGDNAANPEVEMPLEICGASGAQAILFGTFGLRPGMDGTLEIAPARNAALGEARMTGYQFRGHSYDVILGGQGYRVMRDGKPAAQNAYGVRFRMRGGSSH